MKKNKMAVRVLGGGLDRMAKQSEKKPIVIRATSLGGFDFTCIKREAEMPHHAKKSRTFNGYNK